MNEEKPLTFLEMSSKPGERITDKPELPRQGVAMHIEADLESIEGEPHLIARMPDHELWMTFLRDPDRNLIGLMSEVPSAR